MYLLLTGNNTVSILTWRSGRICSHGIILFVSVHFSNFDMTTTIPDYVFHTQFRPRELSSIVISGVRCETVS